jgi:hypothetical protein
MNDTMKSHTKIAKTRERRTPLRVLCGLGVQALMSQPAAKPRASP